MILRSSNGEYQSNSTHKQLENIHQFQQIPVKHIVVSKTLTMEKTTKQLAQVRVVWLVVKTKRSTIVQVSCKLRYKNSRFTELIKHSWDTNENIALYPWKCSYLWFPLKSAKVTLQARLCAQALYIEFPSWFSNWLETSWTDIHNCWPL